MESKLNRISMAINELQNLLDDDAIPHAWLSTGSRFVDKDCISVHGSGVIYTLIDDEFIIYRTAGDACVITSYGIIILNDRVENIEMPRKCSKYGYDMLIGYLNRLYAVHAPIQLAKLLHIVRSHDWIRASNHESRVLKFEKLKRVRSDISLALSELRDECGTACGTASAACPASPIV